MSQKYSLLNFKGNCMNFSLELNFFILSHPVILKQPHKIVLILTLIFLVSDSGFIWIIFKFQYILPTIVAIGAIGNLINLVVLSSKDIRLTSRGHRVSQRSRSMFSYMKALAITDLLYLMMTIQGCVFTLTVFNL